MTKKLNELRSYIKKADTIQAKVSSASIGWHIHHSLNVVNGVCIALMRSKAEDYKISFSLKKTFFLLLGRFPRGRARAPQKAKQPNEITLEDINKQLDKTNKLLPKLNELHRKSHFKHPLFGTLNLIESRRFLRIHTEHHLKIIRDILK